MNNDLINMLSVYKTTILCLASQSMEEMDKDKLQKDFESSFMNIQNILNGFIDEDSTKALAEFMTEIKAELRYKLLKLCQEKLSLLTRYGLENIELFDGEDFKQIVLINDLIKMCNDKIKNTTKQDSEVDEKNKLYVFMKSAIDDLDSYPAEFASDFNDIIDRMYLGNYVGKENRCKIMKDSNLDNSLEHRGNNGTRLYENQIKTANAKINRNIKELEKRLGRKIHFVYKLEVKKCTSANGLDGMREKRYKNSRDKIIEIISGMTASEISEFSKQQKERIEGILNRKKNSTNEEKKYKVIGLYRINEYLHTNYDLRIFDGYKDPSISETEISEENFLEIERYHIFKRLILNLQTLGLEKLQRLDTIFDGIRSDLSFEALPEYLSQGQKEAIKEKEINRIISVIIYTLKDMTVEELLKTERNVIMIMEFEDDYKSYNRNEGIQYG